MIKNFIQWILYSSADPTKLSLTLKAGVPFVLTLLAWNGVDTDATAPLFDQFITDSVNVLGFFVQTVTGVLTFYGTLRKLYNTIRQGTA